MPHRAHHQMTIELSLSVKAAMRKYGCSHLETIQALSEIVSNLAIMAPSDLDARSINIRYLADTVYRDWKAGDICDVTMKVLAEALGRREEELS